MPEGTRQHRINQAIHLHYTTDMTNKEIADELGVHHTTVSDYLNTEIGEEVQEMIQKEQEHVILVSLEELKAELRELHQQLDEIQVAKEDADMEVKIYRDDDGNVVYDEFTDDNGVKQMFKVPQEYTVKPDHKQLFFRRSEWREVRTQIRDVLQEMRRLVGVEQAEKIEIDLDAQHEHGLDDETQELIDQMDFQV